MRVDNQIDHTA